MKIKKIEIKKPLMDIIFNIISNGLPTVLLQLVVYPIVAYKLGATKNDLFLVFMSVVHIIVAATSGALCNTRLLLSSNYKHYKLKGDFNLILFIYSIISIFAFSIVSYLYDDYSFMDLFLLIILGVFWMIRDYLIVAFRLKLEFLKILYNNIILSLGIILGVTIFETVYCNWRIIFIVAYGIALIHVLIETELLKEPFIKTKLFKKTFRKSLVLTCSSCIGLIPSTCGTLFVYQIGDTWTSIYTSALIIGKILSMISTPLTSVLISYIVRIKVISKKQFTYLTMVLLVLGTGGYILCYLSAKPILNFLYPMWALQSMKLVPITIGIAITDLLSQLINPIILHFGNEKWQLIIQGIYSSLYFGLEIIAVNFHSIELFIWINLCLSFLRFVFMIILGSKITQNVHYTNDM